MNRSSFHLVLSLALLTWLMPRAVQSQDTSPAEAAFAQAYFRHTHEHDAAGAIAGYEKVAADAGAPEALRAEARSRLAGLKEDQAAADFAHLMPPKVMGYAELVDPGEHIGRVLAMMGLVGDATKTDKPSGPAIPLGEGLSLPADFAVSPALATELKKLRGAAAAVTSLVSHGRPGGLLVIHPGDCDLVRGAIETAVQLLPQGEPVEGFKTYQLRDIGWVALTRRLVLLSDTREEIVAAVGRLANPQAECLASRADFKRARADAAGALMFAFIDGRQVSEFLGPRLKREAPPLVALLDLDHLESIAVSLSTTENAIQVRARMNLMEGHRNVAYALIRTAPMTKRSLSQVPKGAAGVVVLGLNPPGPAAAPAPGEKPLPPSLMDIGRELFGNIDEIAVFALPAAKPAKSAGGLPEIGVALAVKDPAKSEALWNQILSLVTLFGPRTTAPPSDVTIEGAAGHLYHLQKMPPIAVVRSGENGLAIGTEAAVAASIRAARTGQSIATDPAFAGLLGQLTPTTSKAVLVDAGRALQLAGSLSKGRQAEELDALAQILKDLKVSVVTDEAPNQLTIRADVTGLPKFRELAPLFQKGSRRGVTAAK